MYIVFLLLIIGFILLIKGADYFVDGATMLAGKFHIPPLIIGLTIVAMGTSAPELAISLTAATKGADSLVVNNVLGSNMFNLMVVLGVCSIFSDIKVDRNVIIRDYPVVLVATLLFALFLSMDNDISRWEALVFIVLLIVYMVWTVRSALWKEKKNKEKEKKAEIKAETTTEPEKQSIFKKKEEEFNALRCVLCLIGGAIAIVYGGDMVVENACKIGLAIGMSEAMVGLTICSIGTSLPELVTSITASIKGQSGMAMGNVIGSNIFNIFAILGISGFISPIYLGGGSGDIVVDNTIFDLYIYVGACILTYIFCYTDRKVERWEGVTLFIGYIGYMIYAVMRDIC